MTRNSTISRRWRVFRPWPEALALTMLGAMLGSTGVRAAAVGEPASCRTVHLADVGWTDVTATTAVLGMGVEAGFVIVLLAVILDRVMRIRQRRP